MDYRTTTRNLATEWNYQDKNIQSNSIWDILIVVVGELSWKEAIQSDMMWRHQSWVAKKNTRNHEDTYVSGGSFLDLIYRSKGRNVPLGLVSLDSSGGLRIFLGGRQPIRGHQTLIVLGEHFNWFVKIFLLVNSVVSGKADQSASVKSPRQALTIILPKFPKNCMKMKVGGGGVHIRNFTM